jgi:hypothetical protein
VRSIEGRDGEPLVDDEDLGLADQGVAAVDGELAVRAEVVEQPLQRAAVTWSSVETQWVLDARAPRDGNRSPRALEQQLLALARGLATNPAVMAAHRKRRAKPRSVLVASPSRKDVVDVV